jgi:hypothetical protein
MAPRLVVSELANDLAVLALDGRTRIWVQGDGGACRLPPVPFVSSSQIWTAPRLSQAKLAMRAQADKFEALVIRLAVDQNEIRPDVAVAVIVPFAGKWVIEIPARQRCVVGEQVDDLHQ